MGYYFKTMNSTKVTILVALWTLLLAPLLCGLGMVVHACLDDDGADCHHELACDSDPCQVFALMSTPRDEGATDDAPQLETIDLGPFCGVFSFAALIESSTDVFSDEGLPNSVSCTRTLPLIC